MGLVARVALMVFAVLTLVYICVYLFLREGQKMRLQEDWRAAGSPGDRDEWVEERLGPKSDKLIRWLILWVYAVPLAVLSVTVYLTN